MKRGAKTFCKAVCCSDGIGLFSSGRCRRFFDGIKIPSLQFAFFLVLVFSSHAHAFLYDQQETSITLTNALPVYSLKEPFDQAGTIVSGAEVKLLGLVAMSNDFQRGAGRPRPQEDLNGSPLWAGRPRPANFPAAMARIQFQMSSNKLGEAQCDLRDVWPYLHKSSAAVTPGKVTAAFSPGSGPMHFLLDELKHARASIDIMMYYLSEEKIVDLLCHLASSQKIAVRVLVDHEMGEAAHRPKLEKMAACGVSVYVHDAAQGGKMHSKCAVIDRQKIITGAVNWTDAGFEDNIEDIIMIESPELAAAYLQKMNEFVTGCESVYGDSVRCEAGKPGDDLSAKNDVRVFSSIQRAEAYFTPGRDHVEQLLFQCYQATQSIETSMFLILDPRLVTALCDIARVGRCKVRVIADDIMLAGRYRKHLQKLWEAGVEIVYWEQPRKSMHLKATVIDGRYVWTGSANWTEEAVGINVENMVMLESEDLAHYYQTEFSEIASVCQSYEKMAIYIPTIPTNAQPLDVFARGLPLTGPRTNYVDILGEAAHTNFAVNAYTKYIADEAYLPTLTKLIETAQNSIFVAMYSIPVELRKTEQKAAEDVLAALTAAVQRGVYVYMVLHMPSTPADGIQAAHSKLAERLRSQGMDVRFSLPFSGLHEKMVVVDLCKVLVGSHNWSEGSLDGSRVYESSALIILPEQRAELADHFFSRRIISDMSSRDVWEKEISLMQYLPVLSQAERDEILRRAN